MKILHQTGHNKKWNIDAYIQNGIGDGFIFEAFNFTDDQLTELDGKLKQISSIDLQFYGKKSSDGLGKFEAYSFHPANRNDDDITITDGVANIIEGIKYQEKLGFPTIIIPSYYEERDLKKFKVIITKVNEYLRSKKKSGFKYYMTLALSNNFIRTSDTVDEILNQITNMNICFDGYYVVCESSPGYKQKVSTDYDYLENLSKIFSILKKQKLSAIYGYANWDSIIFLTLNDIDSITIGSYENLRNFNYFRYTEKSSGGKSDGWYFSEKLLNFVKAKEITNIRRNNCLDLIKNENNIFSDVLLDPAFKWNTHKPEVHKNYMLAVSRLLTQLSKIQDPSKRIEFMLNKIEKAQEIYAELAKKKVFLPDESDDYFLGTWKSFLKTKQ